MGIKTYNVIIVEDDELAAARLAEALKAYGDFNIAGIMPSLRKARNAINSIHPDLLFLDIELPDGKGYTMIDKLREYMTWDMKTVFYTAHDKYMLNAIRSAAFDYLLKPFDSKDLDDIVKKFRERKHEEENRPVSDINTYVQAPSLQADNQCFIIQMLSGDIKIVKMTDIGVFRHNPARRIWEVLLYNQEWVPLRSNMKPEQITQYSSQFIRTHQSYIINLSYLAMIHDNMCLLYPPFNQNEIPISNRYKKMLKQRFRPL